MIVIVRIDTKAPQHVKHKDNIRYVRNVMEAYDLVGEKRSDQRFQRNVLCSAIGHLASEAIPALDNQRIHIKIHPF
jgi:hypothetical protein